MAAPKAFKDMPTKHLMCRSLGHAWDIEMVTVARIDGERMWNTALRCLRCRTTRDDLSPIGADSNDPFTFARHYGHAKGYLVEDLKGWGGASLLKRNARDVLYRRLQNGKRQG